MNLRRDPIYITSEVWRALKLLANRDAIRTTAERTEIATVDGLADSMLRETLKSKYPQLFEHQKKVAQMEKELIATLKD